MQHADDLDDGELQLPRDLNLVRPLLRMEVLLQLHCLGAPFYMFVTAEQAKSCDLLIAQWGVWINRPWWGDARLVGRSQIGRSIVPARISKDLWRAFPCTRMSHTVYSFELLLVLRGSAVWVPASDGDVPAYALPLGPAAQGGTEYAARVLYNGVYVMGRLVPGLNACEIVLCDGLISHFRHYDVLAITN